MFLIQQVYCFGQEMVQPCRMDSFGHSPILLSHPRLWGPVGFGAGTVLEAWWMVSTLGSQSFVYGCIIHGSLPRESSTAPSPTTGPFLQPVLCQIRPSASDRYGTCAWAGTPINIQKKERLEEFLHT